MSSKAPAAKRPRPGGAVPAFRVADTPEQAAKRLEHFRKLSDEKREQYAISYNEALDREFMKSNQRTFDDVDRLHKAIKPYCNDMVYEDGTADVLDHVRDADFVRVCVHWLTTEEWPAFSLRSVISAIHKRMARLGAEDRAALADALSHQYTEDCTYMAQEVVGCVFDNIMSSKERREREKQLIMSLWNHIAI